MLKQFLFVMLVIMATTACPTAASPLELLSSTNAVWTADVGNSTCAIAPRISGDSIVATWKVNSGLWTNTWVSIVATMSVSTAGADSIKLLYANNDSAGFSLRLTLRDTTMWQAPAYLNGLVGLQAASFALNATTFPQTQAKIGTVGVFNVDSIRTISFVSNKNPTTLTSAGSTGVFKIFSVKITRSSALVKHPAVIASGIHGSFDVSPSGFFAPKAGLYSVLLYRANGALIRALSAQYPAGFNKVDFSRSGSGVFVVKVSGNGYNSASHLVVR
jgi:hypothetical protein